MKQNIISNLWGKLKKGKPYWTFFLYLSCLGHNLVFLFLCFSSHNHATGFIPLQSILLAQAKEFFNLPTKKY